MRGEEAVKAAERLLDEALNDLHVWQEQPNGTPEEQALAEGIRLRTALAHELGLLQYADEPELDQEPDVDATITCGAETQVAAGKVIVSCALDDGHGGAHQGLVAFDEQGFALTPLEAARLDKAQPARGSLVPAQHVGWGERCVSGEPGAGWRCDLPAGHDGDHTADPNGQTRGSLKLPRRSWS